MPTYAWHGCFLFFTHTNTCACPGSQCFTCKSLCLSRIPTLCMQSIALEILTPAQPPDNANNSSHLSRLMMLHTQILMIVQAPKNSNNSLCRGSLRTTPKLPYAGGGSQCFTHKSLCFYRFPTLHMHIFMLLEVPNSSGNPLSLGSLPTILKIPHMTKINSM
ncbi:hypothetical protein O181_022842 [Austropuccinia psidii MF-1]|uniref:Uncharacterized protein n=1 Tax=Austropuccinia psidii MF-1 TaxID=1389203 RepID=A0A9Q3CGB7_9BASI|nr:hypothetical protein [Austropuccinia psidii MF-1]